MPISVCCLEEKPPHCTSLSLQMLFCLQKLILCVFVCSCWRWGLPDPWKVSMWWGHPAPSHPPRFSARWCFWELLQKQSPGRCWGFGSSLAVCLCSKGSAAPALRLQPPPDAQVRILWGGHQKPFAGRCDGQFSFWCGHVWNGPKNLRHDCFGVLGDPGFFWYAPDLSWGVVGLSQICTKEMLVCREVFIYLFLTGLWTYIYMHVGCTNILWKWETEWLNGKRAKFLTYLQCPNNELLQQTTQTDVLLTSWGVPARAGLCFD